MFDRLHGIIPFRRILPLLHSVVGTVLQISLTGDQSQVAISPADSNLEIHVIPKYLYLQSDDTVTVHNSDHFDRVSNQQF